MDQKNKRINISGPLLCTHAKKLQVMVNERLPEEQKADLKFSEGWPENFKKRWGLRVLKYYWEGEEVDIRAVEPRLPALKEKLKSFELKVIFNCDESGLFYRMTPDRSIAQRRLPGRKKVKNAKLSCHVAMLTVTRSWKLFLLESQLDLDPFCRKRGSARTRLI